MAVKSVAWFEFLGFLNSKVNTNILFCLSIQLDNLRQGHLQGTSLLLAQSLIITLENLHKMYSWFILIASPSWGSTGAGFKYLERTEQIFADGHHAAGVVEFPTIIGRRKNRDQFSVCHEFVSIFNHLNCGWYGKSKQIANNGSMKLSIPFLLLQLNHAVSDVKGVTSFFNFGYILIIYNIEAVRKWYKGIKFLELR